MSMHNACLVGSLCCLCSGVCFLNECVFLKTGYDVIGEWLRSDVVGVKDNHVIQHDTVCVPSR